MSLMWCYVIEIIACFENVILQSLGTDCLLPFFVDHIYVRRFESVPTVFICRYATFLLFTFFG